MTIHRFSAIHRFTSYLLSEKEQRFSNSMMTTLNMLNWCCLKISFPVCCRPWSGHRMSRFPLACVVFLKIVFRSFLLRRIRFCVRSFTRQCIHVKIIYSVTTLFCFKELFPKQFCAESVRKYLDRSVRKLYSGCTIRLIRRVAVNQVVSIVNRTTSYNRGFDYSSYGFATQCL